MYFEIFIPLGILIFFAVILASVYRHNRKSYAREAAKREAEFQNLTKYFQEVLSNPSASAEEKQYAAAQIAKTKLALRKEEMDYNYNSGWGGNNFLQDLLLLEMLNKN